MAKMFYTMEETKVSLARDEEGIKQLAREGRLREFRDGPRLMFKADQVEALKAELAGGELNLAASESGAPIGLAGDSRTGSSIVGLADSATGKSDTHLEVGGVPSPGRIAPPTGSGSGLLNLGTSSGGSGSGLSSGGTRGGINVFEADEKADPSAQTTINPNVQDQVNLEGVGSGSGLLDLTRESDDTSLGAVFDELAPGGRRGSAVGAAAMETQTGEIGVAAVDRTTRTTLTAPIYSETLADPWATALGAAAIVAAICVCLAGFILLATILGYRPDMMSTLGDFQNGSTKMALLLAVGLTAIVGGVGYFVGKGNK